MDGNGINEMTETRLPTAVVPPVVLPAMASTRVGQVMDTVRQRIAARSLMPGARLPSIRAMAQALAVSKSTVVDAYDRLGAEGIIEARRGAGFFVAGHAPPLALADVAPRRERALDPLWITRQSLESRAADLRPGCGWMPPNWSPEASIRRALRVVARDPHAAVAEYGPPLGSPLLRQHLSWRFAQRGIEAAPEQVVLTDSGTQALDLVFRFLLEPGDTVLLDDPCYFNFQALLHAHRVKVVGVPYTPGGPDLERFAQALVEHRPRLYVTNATLHNPTGATLGASTAHRLLRLAEAHNLLIVEDDIFADFEHDGSLRLGALDGLNRVIYIGSFSKTLSAAVRCGYIAARAEWIEPLVDLKLATSFGSSPLCAEVVRRLLVDGSYRRHLDTVHAKLAQAMSDTIGRLEAAGLRPWLRPRGGMFVWAELPHGLAAAEVARFALDRGVVLAPGNVFSVSQSAGAFLRFNVSQCNHPRVFDTLAQAMDAARRVPGEGAAPRR